MSDQYRSRALERIREAVSHLLMPPLSTLQEYLMEKQNNMNTQRTEYEKQLAQIREDGFEAAARLMLPDDEDSNSGNGQSYFQQITKYEGRKK